MLKNMFTDQWLVVLGDNCEYQFEDYDEASKFIRTALDKSSTNDHKGVKIKKILSLEWIEEVLSDDSK